MFTATCEEKGQKQGCKISRSWLPCSIKYMGRSICGFPVGKPFVAMLDVNVEDPGTFGCQDMFVLLPYDPAEDDMPSSVFADFEHDATDEANKLSKLSIEQSDLPTSSIVEDAIKGADRNTPIEYVTVPVDQPGFVDKDHEPSIEEMPHKQVTSDEQPAGGDNHEAVMEEGWVVVENTEHGEEGDNDEEQAGMKSIYANESMTASTPAVQRSEHTTMTDTVNHAAISSLQESQAIFTSQPRSNKRKSTPPKATSKKNPRKDDDPLCKKSLTEFLNSLPENSTKAVKKGSSNRAEINSMVTVKPSTAAALAHRLSSHKQSKAQQESHLSSGNTQKSLPNTNMSSSITPTLHSQITVEANVRAIAFPALIVSQLSDDANMSENVTPTPDFHIKAEKSESMMTSLSSEDITNLPASTTTANSAGGSRGESPVSSLTEPMDLDTSLTTLADAAVLMHKNNALPQQQKQKKKHQQGIVRRSPRKPAKLQVTEAIEKTVERSLPDTVVITESSDQEELDYVDDLPDESSSLNVSQTNKQTKRTEMESLKLEDHLTKFKIVRLKGDTVSRSLKQKGFLYSCLLCHIYKCANKDTFSHHLEEHLSGKLNCLHCHFVASSRGDLMKHVSKEHPHTNIRGRNTHDCPMCNMTFHNIMTYRRHLGNKHDMYQFTCRYCSHCFPSESARMNHYKKEHSELSNFCNTCDKIFPRLSLECFEQHKEKCTGKITCKLCGKKISSARGSLYQHMQFAHEQIRRFPCPQCDHVAKSQANLRHHIEVHEGVKNWKCKICFKSFRLKQTLYRHMITHNRDSGEGNMFKCDDCTFSTKFRTQFIKHMLLHTKPARTSAACLMCKQGFDSLDQLNDHIMEVH